MLRSPSTKSPNCGERGADGLSRLEQQAVPVHGVAATTPAARVDRGHATWRGSLLRRMLGLADFGAVLVAAASFVVGHHVRDVFWIAAFAPVWIVLAKLHGLYDRDQRSLRHLTVDELPSLATWAMTGTAAYAIFAVAAPAPRIQIEQGIRLWTVTVAAAFVFRSAARFLWRRITPPSRTIIVGSGPNAGAARRKLDLFPDIHARVVDELGDVTVDDIRERRERLADVERIV